MEEPLFLYAKERKFWFTILTFQKLITPKTHKNAICEAHRQGKTFKTNNSVKWLSLTLNL